MVDAPARRILRIGLVHNGLVTDERLIAAGLSVTIGPHAGCSLILPSPVLTQCFTLFENDDDGYLLRWADGFTGRVVGPAFDGASELPRANDLSQLVPHAEHRADGSYALRLSADHKGRVRVGHVYVLFHFMPLPPRSQEQDPSMASTVEPPPQARWTTSVRFRSEVQRAVYERVRDYLEDEWGRFGSHPTQPYFALDRGSARAVVRIDPWQEDDAMIRVISWVITGANVGDPALMRFLLEMNHTTTFGGFGIDPEGDIFFSHAIVGSTCDREELAASVDSVLEMADHYDDEIQQRWGGMRALDSVVADEPTENAEGVLARKFSRIHLGLEGADNCIRGLPIPVAAVVELLEAGQSDEQIRQAYPEIEPEDIAQVRAFAAYAEASADLLVGS